MAFTGKLGTSGSQLGKMVLGAPEAAPTPGSISDTTALSEAPARLVTLSRAAGDAVSGSDSIASASGRSATDSTTVSDAAARSVSSSRSTSDTTTVSDAPAASGPPPSGATGGTAFSAIPGIAAPGTAIPAVPGTGATEPVVGAGEISDTIGVSDAVGRAFAGLRSPSDTTTTTDALRSLQPIQRISDSAAVTGDSVLPFVTRASEVVIDTANPAFQTSLSADATAGSTTVEVVSPSFNTVPFTAEIGGETVSVTSVSGTTWTLAAPLGSAYTAGTPVTYGYSGAPGRAIMAQITVGPYDVTRFVQFTKSSWTTFGNGQPGTGEVVLLRAPDLPTLVSGMEMIVRYRGIRVWGGYVETVKRTYALAAGSGRDSSEPGFITLGCVDYNILFRRRIFFDQADPTNMEVEHWPNGTADSIVLSEVASRFVDLSADGLSFDIAHVGTPALPTDSCNPDAPDEFGVGSAGWAWGDVMNAVAQQTGAVYYIDPDRVLRYVDDATAQSAFGYDGVSDAPAGTMIGYRDLELSFDGSQLVNEQYTWGVGQGADHPVLGHVTDPASIAAHGLWQNGELRYDMYCQDSVDMRAESWIYGSPQNRRGGKDPRIVARCTVFVPYFRVADVVQVEVSSHGFSQPMPLRGMEISFPTPWDIRCVLTASHEIDAPWSAYEFMFPDLSLPDFRMPGIPSFDLPVFPVFDPCYGPPQGDCLTYEHEVSAGGDDPTQIYIADGQTEGLLSSLPAQHHATPGTQGGYGGGTTVLMNSCDITQITLTSQGDSGSEWPTTDLHYWYHFINLYLKTDQGLVTLAEFIAQSNNEWFFESWDTAGFASDGTTQVHEGHRTDTFEYGPIHIGVDLHPDGSAILTCADHSIRITGLSRNQIQGFYIASFVSWWNTDGSSLDIPANSVYAVFDTAPSTAVTGLDGSGGTLVDCFDRVVTHTGTTPYYPSTNNPDGGPWGFIGNAGWRWANGFPTSTGNGRLDAFTVAPNSGKLFLGADQSGYSSPGGRFGTDEGVSLENVDLVSYSEPLQSPPIEYLWKFRLENIPPALRWDTSVSPSAPSFPYNEWVPTFVHHVLFGDGRAIDFIPWVYKRSAADSTSYGGVVNLTSRNDFGWAGDPGIQPGDPSNQWPIAQNDMQNSAMWARVRLEANESMYAKWWPDGAAEPSSWMISLPDSRAEEDFGAARFVLAMSQRQGYNPALWETTDATAYISDIQITEAGAPIGLPCDPCGGALPGDLADPALSGPAQEQLACRYVDVDGNMLFATKYQFQPNSTEVWMDGVRLRLGIDYDEDWRNRHILLHPELGVTDCATAPVISASYRIWTVERPELIEGA